MDSIAIASTAIALMGHAPFMGSSLATLRAPHGIGS